MVRIPVFLAKSTHYGHGGVVALAERRLVRQSPEDTVIAVVEAPPGSRVRTRPDPNGPDQLVVPLRKSLLGRLFGARVAIPAKYLIGDAHRREYGLQLAEFRPEAVKGMTEAEVAARERIVEVSPAALSRIFPEGGPVAPAGRSSRLGRAVAAIRVRGRLLRTRLRFRVGDLRALHCRLVTWRLRARLSWIKLRHRAMLRRRGP